MRFIISSFRLHRIKFNNWTHQHKRKKSDKTGAKKFAAAPKSIKQHKNEKSSIEETIKPITQHEHQQINARVTKENHRRKAGLKDFIKGSEEFAEQRSNILRSHSTQQIKQILNSRTDFDNSVYGAAIQKCGNLKDVDFCIDIMEMLPKRNAIPDVYVFNILFQAFKINQRIDCVDKYFEQLINVYQIKPDLITANTLLSIFTKTGNVNKAQRIWEQIVAKYNLTPSERTYSAMIQIYGKNGDIEKAKEFYDEMICNAIQPNLQTQTTMIRAFILSNQIENALKLKYQIQQNGQELDAQCYVCFVGFYLKDTKHFDPDETLKLIQEYESKCKHANDHIMNLKFAANLKLLQNESNTQKKDQLFQTLTRELPEERISNGMSEWNDICATTVFLAHLFYYNDNQALEISQCFERFCELGAIGYWFYCKHSKRWMIDLHGFGYEEIKFILYYLLNEKYDDLVDTMGYHWIIICGKGLSTDPLSKDSQIGIKQCIMDELKYFKINSETNKRNAGRIVLNATDVRMHIETKRKLCNKRIL